MTEQLKFIVSTYDSLGLLWRGWSRHFSTSQKVTSSIPNGVVGILHCHNPSSCTTALGSTGRPAEMSTRNISWWVKAAGVYV